MELEDTDACEDLLNNVEAVEKASRVKKASRMKYAFQLGQRQSEGRKEKAARRSTDMEMRSVDLCVRGTRRKALRKETPEEKATRDRAAKKRLLDSLWLAAATATSLAAAAGVRSEKRRRF